MEQLISTRQTGIVQISDNVYDFDGVNLLSKEDMVSDAKILAPILTASGSFQGAFQNNVRFWKRPATRDAIANLYLEASRAVKCFTDFASAGHRLDEESYKAFKSLIAISCKGQNKENSLDAFKNAEAAAIEAMANENSNASDEDLPATSWNPFH